MVKKILIASALATTILGLQGQSLASEHVKPWTVQDLLVPVTLQDYLKARFGHQIISHEPVESTEHVTFGIIAFLISLALSLAAGAALRKRLSNPVPPDRPTAGGFIELILDGLFAVMADLSGKERAREFLPLIGTLGIFILVSNLMGLVPGLAPPTDNWNTNVAMALVVFFYYHYMGLKTHGPAYIKEFLGPVIKWYALPLMILMFLIEMISHIARPLSLSVRLLGNIFGDHMVIWAFAGMAIPFVPVPFILLGIFVSFVQAFVFCALSAVYLHMATVEEE